MAKAYFLVGFGFVFAFFGYFSLDILISQYLGHHQGRIVNLRAFIILPITLAVEYVIYLMVSYFVLDKVKSLTLKQDSLFQLISLVLNALFLVLFAYLFTHEVRDSVANDVPLQVDSFPAAAVYLSSMFVSLLLLLGLRKAWRQ